jgi:hypothetical protein
MEYDSPVGETVAWSEINCVLIGTRNLASFITCPLEACNCASSEKDPLMVNFNEAATAQRQAMYAAFVRYSTI